MKYFLIIIGFIFVSLSSYAQPSSYSFRFADSTYLFGYFESHEHAKIREENKLLQSEILMTLYPKIDRYEASIAHYISNQQQCNLEIANLNQQIGILKQKNTNWSESMDVVLGENERLNGELKKADARLKWEKLKKNIYKGGAFVAIVALITKLLNLY